MELSSHASGPVRPRASLIVIHPSGHRSKVELRAMPFRMGRQADNHLILRDTRASRSHAQIVYEEGAYWLEDLNSRHGVFVNGVRVSRQRLKDQDRIEFGFPDSYQLIFGLEESPIHRAMEEIGASRAGSLPGAENLSKLRAVVEVARALESSLGLDDVLVAVVEAALAVTGAERGFLLLNEPQGLQVKVARDAKGNPLSEDDLRVPRAVIERALNNRRQLLSMNFDPAGEHGLTPEQTVAALDLRSVVCVPLVRIRAGMVEQTGVLSTAEQTVGLLYLDSRIDRSDLSAGNRELLTTLALEASTVLENARLLEEQRAKQRLEEELHIARQIQQSLLPPALPREGWCRAAAVNIPCHAVGGDYYDVQRLSDTLWSATIVDVSGKGVSASLLAAFLQGVFLSAAENRDQIGQTITRANRFLLERTGGFKYATMFVGLLSQNGSLHWINAGHCPAIIVEPEGKLRELRATGLPVGMLEEASYSVETTRLKRGSKLVAYTDGLTEARSITGEFFEEKRLIELLKATSKATCGELCRMLEAAVREFTVDAPQSDDITILVVEYPEEEKASC